MSTPSPNDTTIIPGYDSITDGSGDIFSITPQGTVYVSNTAGYQPLGYTANVIEAAYVNGHLWQENASHLWWEYTGNPSAPWTGPGTSHSPLPPGTPVSLNFSGADYLVLPANSYSITQDININFPSGPDPHDVNLNVKVTRSLPATVSARKPTIHFKVCSSIT